METEEKVTFKEILGCIAIGAVFATMFVLRIIFQRGGKNMPIWYEKYNEILARCKKRTRCNTIHLWHEETLAMLRARLMDLKVQKIRTRLSGKRIQFKQYKYMHSCIIY